MDRQWSAPDILEAVEIDPATADPWEQCAAAILEGTAKWPVAENNNSGFAEHDYFRIIVPKRIRWNGYQFVAKHAAEDVISLVIEWGDQLGLRVPKHPQFNGRAIWWGRPNPAEVDNLNVDPRDFEIYDIPWGER